MQFWLADYPDDIPLPAVSNLAAGTHLFLFVLDTTANGELDAATLSYDMVTVNVRADD